MTPPEYELDEFVDGVEALDDDDADDDHKVFCSIFRFFSSLFLRHTCVVECQMFFRVERSHVRGVLTTTADDSDDFCRRPS